MVKTFSESQMGKYDITLRHLSRIGCRAFLREIGGEGRVTFLPTDFPTARERRIDYLAIVDSPTGDRTLLHIEFQTTQDAKMPKRMLGQCDKSYFEQDRPIAGE